MSNELTLEEMERQFHGESLKALWEADDLDLNQELPDEAHEELVNLSLDLKEATYHMCFDLIDEQLDFIDEMLSSFSPWKVFHRLFRIKKRKVDMSSLISQGFWSGPEEIVTSRGSFMGDALSFIHLSLLLTGITYSSSEYRKGHLKGVRPLGQSVGDDLLVLKVEKQFALKFNETLIKLGLQTSKLNSSSNDSMTFTEQYAIIPKDDIQNHPKDSRFGDLLYLDIIKGSLLSGKSKVKASGNNPFLGHARMLNKQLAYHPIRWVRQRAPKLIWAANYMECHKLQSSAASLPSSLGGCDLGIGRILLYDEEEFYKERLPYFEALLALEDTNEFIKYSTLLRGIYQANPKGVTYGNDATTIASYLSGTRLIRREDVELGLPEWVRDRPRGQINRYILQELNVLGIRDLTSEFARREAFLRYWNEEIPSSYMTLPLREPKARLNEVWRLIKSDEKIKKVLPENFISQNMADLALRFDNRTWPWFFEKDSKKIREVFGGMPSLITNYN